MLALSCELCRLAMNKGLVFCLFNGVSLFLGDPLTSIGWEMKDLTGQFFAEVQTFGKQGQEKELSQGDMIISLDLKSVSSLPC